MGRPLRPTDDGLVYHAINRGNNRAVVLADADDHRAFLDALGRTQLRYPFRLYGYCLMSNHFHLLLRPEPGVAISRILQSLTVAHTWRHHRRHRTVGHVWQGRFKSPVVQADAHLWTVLRYIEANPLRAGMVTSLADYPWSSYPAHVEGRADPLLTALPEWTDLGADESARRAAWRRKVESDQPAAELEAIRRSLRGGLPYGGRSGPRRWPRGSAGRSSADLPGGRGRSNHELTPGFSAGIGIPSLAYRLSPVRYGGAANQRRPWLTDTSTSRGGVHEWSIFKWSVHCEPRP
jgi:putative transposase